MGIVVALERTCRTWLGHVLRVYVGITGALILVAAVTTSISGVGRLAYSLGEHGQLPRASAASTGGRSSRRCRSIAAAAIAVGLLDRPLVRAAGAFLASLFSFGVLLAFTAAQLAVDPPALHAAGPARPFRVPSNVRIAGVRSRPALVGALLTPRSVIADGHPRGARYGGPVWLVSALVVYVLVRRGRGERLIRARGSADEQVLPAGDFTRILVPMKLGEIGEEMVATAVRLAQERRRDGQALHVIRVPLDKPLDASWSTTRSGGRPRSPRRSARRGPRRRGARTTCAPARSATRSSRPPPRAAPT